MVICTLSVEALQIPLVIVQAKTYTPGIIPVTVDVSLEGVVMVGVFGPLTNAQLPVPVAAVFPANVAELTLHRL